jgi:hypothetical protein
VVSAEPGEQKVQAFEIRGVDLVKVSGLGAGHAVAGGRNDLRFNPRFEQVYCFTSRCACPDGRNPFGAAPLSVQGTDLTLAMTGLPTRGASMMVQGATIADACGASDAGAPLPTALDPCLVGTWRLDVNHATGQYGARLARGGVIVQGLRGGQVLEIQPSRTFTHRMLPMAVLARIPAAAGTDMALDFTGSASGTVGSRGGTPARPGEGCRSSGTVSFGRVASDIAVRYRVRVGMHGLDSDRSLADAVQPGAAHYRVVGDRLTLVPDVPESLESVYTR